MIVPVYIQRLANSSSGSNTTVNPWNQLSIAGL